MLRPTVSRPVCLGVKPHLGPKTRFLWLWDSCCFLDVGRPLWREDGSVVYNCCWSSSTQSFSGPSPAGLMTIFYDPRFETPTTWRTRSPSYIPQEKGGPVIPPGTGFPFLRLLRLAGLWWRCSNRPPHWPLLSRNGSGSSLYSLGTDLTENTACIIACVYLAPITLRVLSHCLATVVCRAVP
jgi:hypothetical protein